MYKLRSADARCAVGALLIQNIIFATACAACHDNAAAHRQNHTHSLSHMRIKTLEVTNFRAIRHARMDFGGSVNTFFGANGSGKSTLVSALRIVMSWFIARMQNPQGRGTALSEADITHGAGYCQLSVTLDDGTSWRLYKQRPSVRSKAQGRTELDALTRLTDALHDAALGFPLVAFYGVDRVVSDIPLRIRPKHAVGQMDAYRGATESHVNFRAFFEWFREVEDMENESLRATGKLVEDYQLREVRRAIEATFGGAFSDLRVRRSPRSFVLKKGGADFRIDDLSDGEKCYIMLVADIARRAAMASSGAGTVLSAGGVVVIDEVDLHLHPMWQESVLPRLVGAFPRCQFFVTTHSPFVVTNAQRKDGGELFLMSGGEAARVEADVYGRSVGDILLSGDGFGVATLRNAEVQSHIDAAWRALEAADGVAYGDERSWLDENVAADDPVFARLNIEGVRTFGNEAH